MTIYYVIFKSHLTARSQNFVRVIMKTVNRQMLSHQLYDTSIDSVPDHL